MTRYSSITRSSCRTTSLRRGCTRRLTQRRCVRRLDDAGQRWTMGFSTGSDLADMRVESVELRGEHGGAEDSGATNALILSNAVGAVVVMRRSITVRL